MTFLKKYFYTIKDKIKTLAKHICSEKVRHILRKYRVSILIMIIILCAICVSLTVADIILDSEHYDKWANAYIKEYKVEYDRYTDVVCAISDASIGIPISNERKDNIKNSVLPETYSSIEAILNKDIHIGEVQETEKTVEEKMDAIFGGTEAVDYNNYYMEVIERNFYYPDMYVFKLVNKSGNTAVITLYLYKNGGIRDVKTSI